MNRQEEPDGRKYTKRRRDKTCIKGEREEKVQFSRGESNGRRKRGLSPKVFSKKTDFGRRCGAIWATAKGVDKHYLSTFF